MSPNYPLEKRTDATTDVFATLAISAGDSMHFIGFSTDDLAEICGTIPLSWRNGIQRQQVQGISTKIKLRGYPWYNFSSPDTNLINSTKMLCAILATLWERNWVFRFAFQSIGGSQSSNSTLMFKRQLITFGSRHWFAICFLCPDTFCTVNAIAGLNEAITAKLRGSIQKQSLGHSSLTIQLNGYPFSLIDGLSSNVEILLVEAVTSQSCEIYASVNIPNSSVSKNTWICYTS